MSFLKENSFKKEKTLISKQSATGYMILRRTFWLIYFDWYYPIIIYYFQGLAPKGLFRD